MSTTEYSTNLAVTDESKEERQLLTEARGQFEAY